MKILLFVIIAYLYAKHKPCRFPGKPKDWEPHVTSPLPHTYLKSVPDTHDWRKVDGKNYVSRSKNQHIPQYCGACWAINSLSSLADRFRIKRDNQWPDYDFATQVMMHCVHSGCHGGWPQSAYSYIKKNGIPSSTCMNFIAKGTGTDCSDFNTCRTCDFDLEDPKKKCYAVKNYTKFYVDEMGSVSGEKEMMAEIYARGPISCGVAVTEEFENYKGGIFEDKTGSRDIGHEIAVVGYGEEDGVKYWIMRNSWGEYWGENGFMRIVRGKDNLGIEDDCTWATPGKIVNY